MASPSPSAAPVAPARPLLVEPPPNFSLNGLVESDGARLLPPLVFDQSQSALQAVLYQSAPGAAAPRAIEVLIKQVEPDLPLVVYGLSPDSDPQLMEQLRTLLGIDEDLSLFYAMADQDKGLAWARAADAGRCLRSPTVFEDLVKCLLLARAQPAQVRELCERLCQALGPRTNLARAGFPSATVLAAAPASLYDRELEAGSLAVPLRKLAEYCATGSFYPESLRRPPRWFGELVARADPERLSDLLEEDMEWHFRVECMIGSLPGFSPRASMLMLPLVGCHDSLALDMATLRTWQQRFGSSRNREPLRHRTPEWERLIQAVQKRVSSFILYSGLAQRLLLRARSRARV